MSAEVESLKKSLTVYRGLAEVSGLIASITDYDELLRAILDVARRVVSAEAASLFLVDEISGSLDLALSSHADGEFVPGKLSVPKGRGIAGWVFEHREAVLVPDAYADPRFYREADRATGFRTRSILCAPLEGDTGLLGVLQVLNPRDKDRFDAEELEGFAAYADLTAAAIEKLRSLAKLRQQERVQRELDIAAEIQRELLSRAIPTATPRARFSAYNRPSANVGGDFYHVFPRASGEIFFAIGDVSGKGIPASLLMAETIGAMQFVFASSSGPHDALEKLNRSLHQRIVRGMFVTLLAGCLDPDRGRLLLASAGHCQPLIARVDGSVTPAGVLPALPLGILPEVAYSTTQIPMGPGDLLISFTDGLTESKAGTGGQFFEEQIIHTSRAAGVANADHLVAALVDAEECHRGAFPQRDDLTLLVGGLK